LRGAGPSTVPSKGNGPPPPAELGADLRVTPNKHRLLQVRRAGKRKLFDTKRKEVFLEWFAATCNVRLSAEKAGVSDKTVHKHLMKDPEFEEAALRALRLGYFRLEARQMQEAHRPASNGAHPHPAQAQLESPAAGSDHLGDGPLPGAPIEGEGYEVRVLPDEAAEEHFDPALAMQLLREHWRRASGGEKRKAQRTTAQSATAKEVADALAKRLKAFGLREMRRRRRLSRRRGRRRTARSPLHHFVVPLPLRGRNDG
jgi:hypothetical protein